MQWNEVPNRHLGLVAGLIGGLGGMVALHYYRQLVEPHMLPAASVIALDPAAQPLADVVHTHALDRLSVMGTLNRPGESAADAVVRIAYARVMGESPSPETKSQLSELMQWAAGIAVGGAYGGTRTTTAPRDLAGSFFYGIRLWLGETFGLAFVGLQPGPTAVPTQEHIRRLLQIWVFTFASTAITRLLYIRLAE